MANKYHGNPSCPESYGEMSSGNMEKKMKKMMGKKIDKNMSKEKNMKMMED